MLLLLSNIFHFLAELMQILLQFLNECFMTTKCGFELGIQRGLSQQNHLFGLHEIFCHEGIIIDPPC